MTDGAWSVKRKTRINAEGTPTESGQAPFTEAEMEGADADVADKGNRSFLSHDES